MTTNQFAVVLWVATAAASCSGPVDPSSSDAVVTPDASFDAFAFDSPTDAGAAATDAWEPGDGSDDAFAVDALNDAGFDAPDAGPPDVDGDGVAADVDCDDGDAAVGRTATRACTNACGTGMEHCADAVWAGCDAPTSCLCTTPGATRTAPCGMCGMRGEMCDASGVWTATGACLGQGQCSPGMTETQTLARCGEQQRLCNASCAWGPWQMTVPTGECTAGAHLCSFGFPPHPCWCTAACTCDPPPAGSCGT